MTIAYVLSQIFIILNYLFLVITYQVKNRKYILFLNFAALIVTGLSYMCLSAYSGLAMVVFAIIRNIIFIWDENKNGKNKKCSTKDYIILIILFLIIIGFAIYTYSGVLSMMSVVATMLYTYSIWQKNTKIYKVLGLPIGILWIVYNIYIFSIFGIVLEIILTISSFIGFIREGKKEKNNEFDV